MLALLQVDDQPGSLGGTSDGLGQVWLGTAGAAGAGVAGTVRRAATRAAASVVGHRIP